MAINWNLGLMPDIGGNALAAFEKGQEQRRQRDNEDALAAFVTNPDDAATQAKVARVNPALVIDHRRQAAKAQQDQATQRRADLPMLLGLLKHARQGEGQWQQALEAAKTYNIDTSGIPPQFDPEWADIQIAMTERLSTPEGKELLTTLAKDTAQMFPELKPGTPEFAAKLRLVWEEENTKQFTVGDQIINRRPNIGGAASSMAKVDTPEEAMKLPPGTEFMTPDGRIGTVPDAFKNILGGAGGDASGNFPAGVPGLVTRGNIDLHNRPVVRNRDGTISTVRSMSIGTDEGEVLIPTVSPDGRIWTDEEAIASYRRSGKHLGIFKTPEEATAYAESLHKEQAREYGKSKPRGGFSPVGVGGETITSTRRSPARNRAVGGVPNSFHLSGRARDSIPPAGMSMGEYHRRLTSLNPGLEVINEGDHIHMEPR